MISNLIIVIFLILILISLLLNYKKLFNRSSKKNSFELLIPTAKDLENDPYINTNNWDFHKKRLTKFGRSQYKGLTFFISSEDRIYYLSEKGTKVYC